MLYTLFLWFCLFSFLIVIIKFVLSNKAILLMGIINFTMYHLKSVLNLVKKKKKLRKNKYLRVCMLVNYLLCDVSVCVCIPIYISIGLSETPRKCWQYNHEGVLLFFMYNIIYCLFRMKPFQILCNYFII